MTENTHIIPTSKLSKKLFRIEFAVVGLLIFIAESVILSIDLLKAFDLPEIGEEFVTTSAFFLFIPLIIYGAFILFLYLVLMVIVPLLIIDFSVAATALYKRKKTPKFCSELEWKPVDAKEIRFIRRKGEFLKWLYIDLNVTFLMFIMYAELLFAGVGSKISGVLIYIWIAFLVAEIITINRRKSAFYSIGCEYAEVPIKRHINANTVVVEINGVECIYKTLNPKAEKITFVNHGNKTIVTEILKPKAE